MDKKIMVSEQDFDAALGKMLRQPSLPSSKLAKEPKKKLARIIERKPSR